MEQRNGAASHRTSEYDLQEQLSDFWAIVNRHLPLVALSLVITLAIGCLYYLKAPRTFESSTEILISTKRVPGFGSDDDERPVFEKTIETHALMIRSQLIVGQAVAENGLDKLPSLEDEESVVDAIIEALTVKLREENTSILLISYTGSDPEDCQAVVAAISAAYESFLAESSRLVGQETLLLITQASQILDGDLTQKSNRFQEFQKDAPLLWREGQAYNRHRERQNLIEQERHQLTMQREQLVVKVEALEEAIRKGDDAFEAAYYRALGELNPDDVDLDIRMLRAKEYEEFAMRHTVRAYIDQLMAQYIDLQVREREMREEFGEGHDDLTAIASSKRMVLDMLRKASNRRSPLNSGGVTDDIEDEKANYVDVYLASLNEQLRILDRQIDGLNAQFDHEQSEANKIQGYLATYENLKDDKERTSRLFDSVVAQLDEISVLKDHGGDEMRVLASPKLGAQIAPGLLRVALASLFLGTFAGCLLAWFVDRSEQTFRSISEIRQMLGVPVVGRIPLIKRSQQLVSPSHPDLSPILCTVHQESSHLSESFRGVRTSLYFSTSGQDHKVIQVTSPLPGDGKSTIVANLAVAIAKSGKSVLVLDADFRRPSLSKLLGAESKSADGLAAVVAGKVDPVDAALSTEIDNLYFMPAGQKPHNPSELLSRQEFKDLLDFLRERYDFVLVDTPPVLAVTDPCAVAARVDGVLLAIRLRKGIQMAATRARETLKNLDADILGVVLNGVERSFDETNRYGYGYGYGYGYNFGGYTQDGIVEAAQGNGAASNEHAASQTDESNESRVRT